MKSSTLQISTPTALTSCVLQTTASVATVVVVLAMLVIRASAATEPSDEPGQPQSIASRPVDGHEAGAAQAVGGASATRASSESIRQWVRQLSSDDYGVREGATQNLTRVGRAALSEVAAAAQQDDLEVTTRAVSVLRTMLESGDVETEDAAAAALEQVAKAQVTSSAGQAADILHYYDAIREQRAINELRRLGGLVQIGNPRTGQVDCQQVILGVSWHGKSSDLSLLKRVSDLEYLGFHCVALTDEDLPALEGLPHLNTLELFGTRVSQAGVERLRQAYPGAKIDRRSNAMLGVKGGLDATMCRIDEVQSGTAAERAGLMADDIVMKFQGHPVNDFDQLTVQIANCQAGDNVTVQIRRGDETIDKPVTLGEWR